MTTETIDYGRYSITTKMFVPVTISVQHITDLFITALEGGSNYWLYYIKCEDKLKDEKTWHRVLCDSCIINLEYAEGADDEPDAPRRVTLDSSEIINAIGETLQTYPDLLEDHDAESADFFLQTLLLGEIVYG
jgi:hypothetical protein